MNKKGFGQIIFVSIALVVLVVVASIVGTVEDGMTKYQTLTGTILDYVEPLTLLGGLVLAGSMGIQAMRR